jgi:L-ascorbate metabolism protein UlaG (beta-lactamase superfamily)
VAYETAGNYVCFACSSGSPITDVEVCLMEPKIDWLGHAAFRISAGKIIYIDPFQLKDHSKTADIIFITHEHFDHCSVDDIAKLATPETIIVTVPDCQSKLSGLQFKDFVLVEPDKEYIVEGIKIQTIPAYNLDKDFHPKDNDWVGFIITIAGKRIYHAGDTDAIPEMNSLRDIDFALVPVSGKYVMTAEEAAKAVNRFKPKVAIPMHYGAIVGDSSDADKFKELCEVEVRILDKS